MAPSAARSLEPLALAMLLGLASVVPVAWALGTGPGIYAIERAGWRPLGSDETLLLAVGSVIPASIAGGLAGAWTWARRQRLAPVVALSVAWVTGIIALPMAAAAFGIHLREGIGCLDACRARLNDADPFGGLRAYAELMSTWPYTSPYLLLPAGLFVLARRFGHPILWLATGLSGHATLHWFSIGGGSAGAIYAALLIGVVLWTGWLSARDAGWPVLRTAGRRWTLAVASAAVVTVVTATASVTSWIPIVPEDAPMTHVGTAELHGFNPPDPSDWFPPIVVPRTPHGDGCFAPITGAAGRLELCWEGYRDNREHLPGGDIYHFRLLARLFSTGPTSWVRISIELPDDERTLLSQVWPRGVVDGACRNTGVDEMNFLTNGSMTTDLAEDAVCGRTTAARSPGWHQHWITWTCTGCGADAAGGRQIAIRELVGTDQGSVPTWTVSAALGP